MGKSITRVRWSAQNVPWGMSFDEKTGTFSGTPEEAGEYTVPVSVETNYGKDTKNVNIIVSGGVSAYNVYAIGSKAATWSRNATPDEYGFRGLDMPEAYELVQNYKGFGAITPDNKFYCCGLYDMDTDKVNTIGIDNTGVFASRPRLIEGNVCRILAGHSVYSTGSASNNTSKGCSFILKAERSGKMFNLSGYTSKIFSGSTNLGYAYSNGVRLSDTVGVIPEDISILQLTYRGYSPTANTGYRILDTDGRTASYYSASSTGEPQIVRETIGYKALKTFNISSTSLASAPLFKYLSANKYLDNTPENFQSGGIKDAWANNKMAYVLTDSNELYEKTGASGSWDLQGIYDVKKLLMASTSGAFILTKDGGLYYKGSAISGITGTYTQFTRMFDKYYFYDMTYDNDEKTLTVLKDE